jgi:hypothetical protein
MNFDIWQEHIFICIAYTNPKLESQAIYKPHRKLICNFTVEFEKTRNIAQSLEARTKVDVHCAKNLSVSRG